MLTFLRKVRKSLIETSSTRKYLLYAIGEILLVMVGILLALQVNNWNEWRKDRRKESNYLKDIKADLQMDTIELNSIIKSSQRRLSIYHALDQDFNLNDELKIAIQENEYSFRALFNRGISYRPIKGSYSSLISDGQSKLIQNRQLFNLVQEIYDVGYSRVASLYETLKDVHVDLNQKRAFEKK